MCVLADDVNSVHFGKEEGKNPLRVRVLYFIEMGVKKPTGTRMPGQEKRNISNRRSRQWHPSPT